tara:strand:+ start:36170 stop:36727 length:558 start_codon:yes stop_codon:yes gene_type:complete
MLRLLQKDVIPAWGSKKVSAISRRDVVVLLDKIRDRGAAIMANRVHGRLTRLFNFACERGILEQTPMNRLRKTVEIPRDRVLYNSEIKLIWHNLDVIGVHPLTSIALKFMLVTGQRAGEVTHIEWSEIDFDKNLWLIPADKSKNGRSHTVPLTNLSLALLTQTKTISSNACLAFPSPQNLRSSHL